MGTSEAEAAQSCKGPKCDRNKTDSRYDYFTNYQKEMFLRL